MDGWMDGWEAGEMKNELFCTRTLPTSRYDATRASGAVDKDFSIYAPPAHRHLSPLSNC